MIRTVGAAVVAAAAALGFLLGALDPHDGKEAAFAAFFVCLLGAGAAGPFLRAEPRAVGALTAAAVLVCTVFAGVHGGPVGAALLCGLFSGLYALALGALARRLRAPVAAVALGALAIALLFTIHYGDTLLLPLAEPRTAAYWAFAINPASAGAVTLDFDWAHAKALYTNNQTAENVFGVPLRGAGPYSLWLLGIAAAALVPDLRRRA
ncbi:MAG: hypothetical protein ACYTGN_17550 [Planctomycetota bacterium]